MKTYKEFQFFWLVFALAIPAHLLIIAAYFYQFGKGMSTTEFMAINATLGLLYILFYGMKTTVKDNRLTVSFGIGLIHRNVNLGRVKLATSVKTAWYYGWGIRFIPHGMLFNISGDKGVELAFNDSKRVLRIGSQHSDELLNEILHRIR